MPATVDLESLADQYAPRPRKKPVVSPATSPGPSSATVDLEAIADQHAPRPDARTASGTSEPPILPSVTGADLGPPAVPTAPSTPPTPRVGDATRYTFQQPSPARPPLRMPRNVAVFRYNKTPSELAYAQAQEDLKRLPPAVTAPGYHEAEFGPVSRKRAAATMALGRFATQDYPQAVEAMRAEHAALEEQRRQIEALHQSGKPVSSALLANYEGRRRGIEQRVQELEGLRSRYYAESHQQSMDANGRVMSASNRPLHLGLSYPGERQPPTVAEEFIARIAAPFKGSAHFIASFFAGNSMEATAYLDAARAEQQWEGRYPLLPPIPYRGAVGQERGIREKNAVIEAFRVLESRLQDDGTVTLSRGATPELRQAAARVRQFSKFQKDLIPVIRRQRTAERDAFEAAGIAKALGIDLAALASGEVLGPVIAKAINNPLTRSLVKSVAPDLFVRYAAAGVAPKIAEAPLSRAALNRLLIRQAPAVATHALTAGGVGGTTAAGITAATGGTSEEILHAFGEGAKATAAFGGLIHTAGIGAGLAGRAGHYATHGPAYPETLFPRPTRAPSVRETPHPVLEQAAAGGDPQAQHALIQREAWDVQQHAPLPDDRARQGEYLADWKMSPTKRQFEALQATARDVARTNPVLAEHLTRAAHSLRDDFQYTWVRRHAPENTVDPTIGPPRVSAWRAMSDADRAAIAALPKAQAKTVKDVLLYQDIENSGRTLFPEREPVTARDQFPRFRNQTELEKHADDLYTQVRAHESVLQAPNPPESEITTPGAPPVTIDAEPVATTPPALTETPPPVTAAPTSPVTAPVPRTPTKPLWEMNLEELQAAETAAKAEDQALLVRLFGEEGAHRYRALDARANSSYASGRDMDAAWKQIEQMEATLTPAERDQLHGVGTEEASLDDVREFRRALDQLDTHSARALGDSLKWAVTKVGEASDPAQMTHEERVAYATLREGMRIAKAQGFDTGEVTQAAIRGSAARFSDPEDAAFMLRRFVNEGPAAEAKPAPKLAAEPKALPEGKPAYTGPERRVDVARRKKIDELTEAEAKEALRRDELSGIQNLRAWNEVEKKPHVAYIDADGLGYVNDNFGHAAGDAHIQALGNALRAVGLGDDSFRIGGDEILVHGDDAARLRQQVDAARKVLENSTVRYTDENGQEHAYTGVSWSVGFGGDRGTADAGLKAAKAERTAAGLRAREKGGRPPGLVERGKEGGPVQAGDEAPVRAAEPGAGRGNLEGARAPVAPKPAAKPRAKKQSLPQEQQRAGAPPVPPRRPPKGAREWDSGDPKFDQFARETEKGPAPEGRWRQLVANATRVKNGFTRIYEHLPRGGEYAAVTEELKRAERGFDTAQGKTFRLFRADYEGLDNTEYQIMRRARVLRDMTEEIAKQKDRWVKGGGNPASFAPALPRQFTEAEVAAVTQSYASKVTPKIEAAIQREKATDAAVLADLFDAMEPVTGKKPPQFDRQEWLHHAVIQYLEGKQAAGGGKAVKVPGKLNALQKRVGSTNDYITGLIEARSDWIPGAIRQQQFFRLIKTIEDHHDISPEVFWKAMVGNDPALEGAWSTLATGKMPGSDVQALANGKLGKLAAAGDLPDTLAGKWAPLIQELAAMPAPLSAEAQKMLPEYARWLTKPKMVEGAQVRRSAAEAIKLKAALGRDLAPADILTLPDYQGHVGWMPEPGSLFDLSRPMAANMVSAALADLGEVLKVDVSAARKALFRGMVIPEALGKTLHEFGRAEGDSFHAFVKRGSNAIMRGFKWFRIVDPQIGARYFKGNLLSGVGAMLQGNVKALAPRIAGRAFKEFTVFSATGKEAPMLAEWLDRGGMDDLFEAHETGKFLGFKPLAQFSEKPPAKAHVAAENLWALLTRYPHHAREAIERYASFLAFHEDIMRHGRGQRPSDYAASIPAEIDALPDVLDKAMKLSRELSIDYAQTSPGGTWVANNLAPFARYFEGNIRREIQLILGPFMDPELTQGKAITLAGRRLTGRAAMHAMNIIITGMGLEIGSAVYNQLFFPEAEAELDEDTRFRPHIILPGRGPKGEVRYVDWNGNLVDFLGLAGIDNTFKYVDALVNHRMTPADIARDIGTSAGNRWAQQIGGPIKPVVEIIARKKFYPDAFHPTPMRDPWEYAFDQVNASWLYRLGVLPGTTRRPMKEGFLLARFGTKSVDTDRAVFYQSKDYAREWLAREDPNKAREIAASGLTPRSNALYLWREAARAEEQDLAMQHLFEYRAQGGTEEDFTPSLMATEPLYALNGPQEKKFLEGLSPADRGTWRRTYLYWQELLAPGTPVSDEEDLGRFISRTRRTVDRYVDRHNPLREAERENPELRRRGREVDRAKERIRPKR